MSSNRLKVLLGIAGVLVALFVWNFIANWGLVTVHVQSKPLSTVIKSIERQGGIKIVTNADQSQAITMDVDLVSPATAVDVLSARLDGNWSVGYVAGPSKAEVAAGIASISDGGRDRDYRTFGFGGFGGGGGGGMDVSDTVVDAREVVWKVSDSDKPQLQTWLNQLSIKTGLMAMVPRDWDPEVSKAPTGGKAASALRAMVKSVKGTYEEIFIVRVQTEDRNANNGQGGGPDRVARTEGNFTPRDGGRDGGRPNFNPEWMADRAEARIAQLPKEEQAEAKKNFDEMRAFFDKMRTLPDDQRQVAMQQFFDRPDVQEKMAERQAARDEKSGPQKRADRARNYLQRKAQITSKTSS